jgi:hypothetical protein
MLKRIVLGWFLMLAAICAAHAQLSQSTVTNTVNSQIGPNGQGLITGTVLQSALDTIVSATFQSQGTFGLLLSGTPVAGYVPIATGATTAAWSNNFTDGILINPPANTLISSINSHQTGPTSGAQSGSQYFNSFSIDNDQTAVTGGAGTQVSAMLIFNQFGGGNTQGARSGLFVSTNLNAATNASNNNHEYIGIQTLDTVSANDGGTNTGAGRLGSVDAFNSFAAATAAATNYNDISAAEFDTQILTGGSSYGRHGLKIISFGNVNGVTEDAAFAISTKTSAVSWTNGILFTNWGGAKPVATAGCMICTDGTANTVATGIDLSAYTATNAVLKGTTSDTGQGINMAQAGPTSGTTSATINYNTIFVNGDNHNNNNNLSSALNIEYGFGGGNFEGGINALNVYAHLNNTGNASNSNPFYGAINAQFQAFNPDVAASAVVTINSFTLLQSGATGYHSIEGLEVQTGMVTTGGSAYRVGINVTGIGGFQGASGDAAIVIGASTGGKAWIDAVLVSHFNGIAPLDATNGCIICTGAEADTIKTGIDLSSYTITGNFLAGPGTTVTGAGAATFTGPVRSNTGFNINGTAGVTKTCTVNQALTLIFTNGILTGGTCNT